MLAAGKSTRFKSSKPKVIHPLCGKPLVSHVLDKLRRLKVDKAFVVIGTDGNRIREELAGYPVEFVVQEQQLGTAHAVMAAHRQLKKLKGSLLITYGDTPLIETKTLRRLIETRERNDADQVLLTAEPANPHGLGRIIRDENGEAVQIVEEKDASPKQKLIPEINAGFNCFKISSLLDAFAGLSRSNAAGEYYLTDVLHILRARGKKVMTVAANSAQEVHGVNTREELAAVETVLRARIARKWMLAGATILSPSSVLIDETVVIAPDTLIYPGVVLEGKTRVGRGCTIFGFCHLKNAVLGEGVTVDHCSVIRNSRVGRGGLVGPFAHLRGEVLVGSGCRIGNFVEIKQSRIGNHTKAAHLSYIGDAEIGNHVNLGAGTITCNYDGANKNKTVVEDQVFVGSDSQLIAPVTVRKGAYIAAGSSVTDDVPEQALAIARQRQINKEGWTRGRKSRPDKGEKRGDNKAKKRN